MKEPKSGRNKFFFEMKVIENKPLLPSTLRKVAKQLEDYPFASLEVQGLAGTVEKSGQTYSFTARASNQKYVVQPSDEIKKMLADGKRSLTLSGLVTQKAEGDPVVLEITEAKETAK